MGIGESREFPDRDEHRTMPLTASILSRQLEELSLLKHSLLPGEALIPASPSDHQDGWQALLESWQEDGDTTVTDLERAAHALPPAHFRIEAAGVDVWFELRLGEEYVGPQRGLSQYTVSVKGATLGRADQAAWQAFVKEKMAEVQQDSECVPGFVEPPRRCPSCLLTHHTA